MEISHNLFGLSVNHLDAPAVELQLGFVLIHQPHEHRREVGKGANFILKIIHRTLEPIQGAAHDGVNFG